LYAALRGRFHLARALEQEKVLNGLTHPTESVSACLVFKMAEPAARQFDGIPEAPAHIRASVNSAKPAAILA
jgi:hypothetical protein